MEKECCSVPVSFSLLFAPPPNAVPSQIRSYPGISQVCLIGDKQKFISALVTANLPEVQTLLESEGWTVQDFGRTKVSEVTYKDLISFSKFHDYVDARVTKVGSYFPKAHRVKKWVFLPAVSLWAGFLQSFYGRLGWMCYIMATTTPTQLGV